MCGHGGWCRSDGAFLICQRALREGGVVRNDRNGGEYYLYRLEGTEPTRAYEPEAPQHEDERASDQQCDRIYNALLDELVLPTPRLANLLARGLPGEAIERGKFREHPGSERARGALSAAQRKINVHWFCDVPGFYKSGGKTTHIAGSEGLLLPVRNLDGLIVALRVRLDDPGSGARYRWLSRPDGPNIIGAPSGAHVHVPLHTPTERGETVRVTEGELKAEVAFAKTRLLTIGVPGVGLWRLALPTMKLLGVKRVVLAWDSDQRKNPHVARALERAAIAYREEGFEVGIETWPSDAGKGIDDVLIGTAPDSITQLWGAAAWEYIAALVSGVGKEPELSTERNGVLDKFVEAGPLAHEMAMRPEVIDAAAHQFEEDPQAFETMVARVKPYVLVTQFRGAVRRAVTVIRAASKTRGQGKARVQYADDDWRSKLARNATGDIAASLANACDAFTHAPEWQAVFGWDEFRNCCWKLRAPPWDATITPPEARCCGEWSDEDDIRAAHWIERMTGARMRPQAAGEAVQIVAQKNTFHPVRDWLESLSWDGKPRIQNWLTTYLGARAQPEAYLMSVGPMFLIAAIARVMDPGCKVDHMLVLEGPQGAGKSSAIRALASAEFYAVHGEAAGTKDSYVILRGQWILEIAELDSLARSETSAIKRYLTQQGDTYRPPYGRRAITIGRQCVFMGSTNQDAYLQDETGARRFWPVFCGEILVALIEEDREQLWAEALVWYRESKPWWPTAETAALLGKEQDARYREDAWEEVLRDFLAAKTDTRMQDLLRFVVGEPANRKWEDRDKMRVGKILKRLGWVRWRVRLEGSGNARGYVYAKPGHRPDRAVDEANDAAEYPPSDQSSSDDPIPF